MMPAPNTPQRARRLPVTQPANHLFALGQAVQLKGGLSPSGNVYLVTAKLPPSGDSPQYRIRNDAEKFERMATEVSLEPVSPSLGGEKVSLIEKSFGLDPRK